MESAHGHYSCRWQGRSKVVLKQQSSRTPGAPSEIYKELSTSDRKILSESKRGRQVFSF